MDEHDRCVLVLSDALRFVEKNKLNPKYRNGEMARVLKTLGEVLDVIKLRIEDRSWLPKSHRPTTFELDEINEAKDLMEELS